MKNPKEGFELTAGRGNGSVGYQDALENMVTNLNWSLVYSLFDLPDFNSSPIWMAEKLDLSVEEVLEILDGLKVLGILKQSERGYEQILDNVDHLFPLEDMGKDDVRAKNSERHALVSQQVLNGLSAESIKGFSTNVFPTNAHVVYWMTTEILKIVEEGRRRSLSEPKTGVYVTSFTAIKKVGK